MKKNGSDLSHIRLRLSHINPLQTSRVTTVLRKNFTPAGDLSQLALFTVKLQLQNCIIRFTVDLERLIFSFEEKYIFRGITLACFLSGSRKRALPSISLQIH